MSGLPPNMTSTHRVKLTADQMAKYRAMGNRVPDFKPEETLVGQPTYIPPELCESKKTNNEPYGPLGGLNITHELIGTLLVARKKWETAPDDPELWKTYISVYGEIYGRLERDITRNGSEQLTDWAEYMTNGLL